MKRLLLSAVLLGAAASPVDAQTLQRAPNNYVVGPIISCLGLSDGNTGLSRCLLPAMTIVDQTGATLGTAGNGLGVTQRGVSSIATGQVAVGTTSTLVAAARPGRQSITVEVTTAVQCSYGNAGVTLTTGFPLAATAYGNVTINTSAAIYAVCASAATVGYLEQY